MITTDVASLRPRIPRIWILFIALAVLPFLLRLNLDLNELDLQTVQSLYRVWRWSPEGKVLKTGSTLIFKKHDEKDISEEFFLRQLQRDFKVVEFGDAPRVSAYFETKSWLRGRIEIILPGEAAPRVWEGESRLPNNGLLLGPWLGSLLVILGRPPWMGIVATAATLLFWDANWNPLEIPARLVDFGHGFWQEMHERYERNDWIATEMGRVPAIALLLWLLPAAFIILRFFRRVPVSTRNFGMLAAASLVLEPLALWTSELFGKWATDAAWWKVYLGSFAYRFVLMAFIVALYLKPRLFADDESVDEPRKTRFPLLVLLLPVAFIVGGGWEWLSAAVMPGVGQTLLRFRIFVVGWLLSYLMGSRVFSLWLGIFALAVHVPPTTGHWNASALYGLMADGLLLGWWMSPHKGIEPVIPAGGTNVVMLAFVGWLVGVLLSSVGVPLGVCWLALVGAVWGYGQVMAPPPREPGAFETL